MLRFRYTPRSLRKTRATDPGGMEAVCGYKTAGRIRDLLFLKYSSSPRLSPMRENHYGNSRHALVSLMQDRSRISYLRRRNYENNRLRRAHPRSAQEERPDAGKNGGFARPVLSGGFETGVQPFPSREKSGPPERTARADSLRRRTRAGFIFFRLIRWVHIIPPPSPACRRAGYPSKRRCPG